MAPKITTIKEKQQFNRQINFFIMRKMWQHIRGKGKDKDDTIYVNFNMSRERYTRGINTGIISISKAEQKLLEKNTGIAPRIFTGETRFRCLPVNAKEEDPDLISEDEWKKLFKLRSKRKKPDDKDITSAEYKRRNTAYKVMEKKIIDKLYEADPIDINNENFYNLCFYLINLRSRFLAQEFDNAVEEITTSLDKLSFDTLDGCNTMVLDKFQQEIKQKSSLVNSILQYKKASKRNATKKAEAAKIVKEEKEKGAEKEKREANKETEK